MPEKNEVATKRIALTPTHFDQLRDFSRGLGATYDEAIEFLLSNMVEPGEDELMAGRRLRARLTKGELQHQVKKELPYDDDPAWNESIARSLPALQRLADKAHADYLAGRTEDFDPDNDPDAADL